MKRNRNTPKINFLSFTLVLFFFSCVPTNSDEKPVITNNLTLMESAFGKFKSITYRSDEKYFYISSTGIPDHNMMIGITNWQQQVPINQTYTDNNSWAIPLKPELSTNPLSMKTNLMKGAIAIAANGIPIFNPLNNRGEDANAIGELDQWGGHSGKADDYHYHLPPTHLQDEVGVGKPIAFAMDGFPVYGETTEKLDEFLGRVNSDGSYQYHTIKQYPYFIASMRGKVTLDPATSAPENQVIPQAITKGVRPPQTPLSGATIVNFKSTSTNAFSLQYKLNTENYFINYNWDSNNNFTFEFISPNGAKKTEIYKR